MKIAIGIPAYKAQSTIEECLSSINIQSMRQEINVIIANDNPGDDYTYLSTKFPKLHITYAHTEHNGGPGIARNKCIEVSNDDYIMFMDADDCLYTPYAVEALYRAISNPSVIQSQGTFVQECTQNNQHILMPQKNPNHPWSFGRLTNLAFLKQMGIDFGRLPNMEDGRFQWCINLVIEGTQWKRNIINEIVYTWKEGSEHSITRGGASINGGIPVYNYSMCQIGASIAAKQAVELALAKNPFNGSIQRFLLEQMIGHYFTYYECLEKCPKFAEQNWWLSKWFYHNAYSKYTSNITQPVVDKYYMQMLSQKANTLSKYPELTYNQWIDKIANEEYKFEELADIRSKLPAEILDIERKSGSLTAEARDDALRIFDVDK